MVLTVTEDFYCKMEDIRGIFEHYGYCFTALVTLLSLMVLFADVELRVLVGSLAPTRPPPTKLVFWL